MAESNYEVGYPYNRTVANALRTSLQRARTPSDRSGLRAIVMYSGGLDSVALLANVLKETDQQVHVHHIEIRNRENRADVENQSVRLTLDYIRTHYRDFDYSSSVSEFPVGLGGGTDLQLALFTAGRLTTALSGAVDLVYTGHIQPPFWELSEGAAVFNAVFIQRRFKPEWLWPFSCIDAPFNMRKVHIWESIPEELAEMSWSCRRPADTDGKQVPCGECHACKSRSALQETLVRRTPVKRY